MGDIISKFDFIGIIHMKAAPINTDMNESVIIGIDTFVCSFSIIYGLLQFIPHTTTNINRIE